MNVLFGAMGRHNFGDMLMPHVIQKLMPDTEFVVADLLERDMTEYGGHKVVSIASLFDSNETVNVIHLGGQVGACTLQQAAVMLEATEQEIDDFPAKDLELAYLLPKSRFKNPGVFIANSIGGWSVEAHDILCKYDYVSYRDTPPKAHPAHWHTPDCAVMVRELFADRIRAKCCDPAIHEMTESIGEDYIAVQISAKILKEDGERISDQIREISEQSELPIVFFCAGTAPAHDRLQAYVDNIAELPSGMAWHFDNYDIWNLCNVIAYAKLVISTSLHVRMVAAAYQVPRVSFGDKKKVKAFDREWDSEDTHVEIEKLVETCKTATKSETSDMPRWYMQDCFNRWSKLI